MFSIIAGRSASTNLLVWAALTAGALVAGCNKVPLLAPSLSTISLSASSTVVQSNGTVQVSATVLTQPGTPVQNGTHVTFSTDLGSVSPTDVTTMNGVATVQFIANGQSGIADVHATSGSAKDAAGTSTSTFGSTLKLTVGGAAAARVLVTASPSRVSSTGGSSTITATVSDANGNPLIGVTVAFTTDNGTVSNTVATTNSSGQATTTLTTTTAATVTATVSGSGTNTVTPGTVKVTVAILPTLSFGATSPTSPVQGQAVTFTVTIVTTGSTDLFQSVVVDFGDGTSQQLGPVTASTPVSHVYNVSGTFTVTATGTSAAGDSSRATTVIFVAPRTPIGISLTATPNPSSLTPGSAKSQPVTFTVTFDSSAPSNISGYDWAFGDGATRHTTGKTTQYAYSTVSPANGFPATVTVTTVDGNSGTTQTQVVVTP